MDEHDDDLESTVHEEAEQETDAFPDTSEELEPQADQDDDEKELDLDDDKTEL